ncbi:hypothetical protein BD626DRAFT_273276 [Schizophyllum amplum]|uniref:Uncharacterized protein n=1 Tax=Schizophyllum amplum TaxID=97359 RepID=A0A550CFT8_9AGAR|nr:hypothetical protein BD626DRAFT_273276 [Auriculariopsis ampla]
MAEEPRQRYLLPSALLSVRNVFPVRYTRAEAGLYIDVMRCITLPLGRVRRTDSPLAASLLSSAISHLDSPTLRCMSCRDRLPSSLNSTSLSTPSDGAAKGSGRAFSLNGLFHIRAFLRLRALTKFRGFLLARVCPDVYTDSMALGRRATLPRTTLRAARPIQDS